MMMVLMVVLVVVMMIMQAVLTSAVLHIQYSINDHGGYLKVRINHILR